VCNSLNFTIHTESGFAALCTVELTHENSDSTAGSFVVKRVSACISEQRENREYTKLINKIEIGIQLIFRFHPGALILGFQLFVDKEMLFS
jgi:hypothetical protein